ncbi:hypothetical protein F8O07_06555 [Pseudoclavibacter sp. CFCC 13796]|uniref:hypothetical protein n=1 Tax=unclassified Pseudoclavibacter TaxID=2615177 RepID=UPI001300E2B3|nr:MULTISPECIES: hypothetical protein [unclassified Pseudoclavibacter]KAB1661560.1 hypothetical protein F8O07_06555 [Pseudoclavibacter sp. CFCC 13796]MCD7100557.1 hypothetical protein [Pseudoclavibacter sp. 13-3]
MSATATLDRIIDHGTTDQASGIITCADGAVLGVYANSLVHSLPMADSAGPYTHLEVVIPEGVEPPEGGWIINRDQHWRGYVEVEDVRELIARHGGEAAA